MSETQAIQLYDNEYVKEILAVMRANRVNAGDFLSVLRCAQTMERQLDAALTELTAVRRELNELKEIRNHPVRTALKEAVNAISAKLTQALEQLELLKKRIVEGAKRVLAAMKDRGVASLANITRRMNVKAGLQGIRKCLNDAIREDKAAIASIEATAAKCHEAGRRVRNVGRALAGRDSIREANINGEIARSLQAPFRVQINYLTKAVKSVDVSLVRLNQLEQSAQVKREAMKSLNPSVIENLDRMKEKAAQSKTDAPIRTKRQEASL